MMCSPLARQAEWLEDPEPAVEGEPRLPLRRFTFNVTQQDRDTGVTTITPVFTTVRAYASLPPTDALGLLEGVDETGLMVWDGALRLAAWMARNPARLRGGDVAAATHQGVDHGSRRRHLTIVELGCGSGVAGIAAREIAAVEFREDLAAPIEGSGDAAAPSSSLQLLLTDGNAECVALAQRNLALNVQRRRGGTADVDPPATVLSWGDAELSGPVAHAIRGDDGTSDGSRRRLLIVAADVIYSTDAVIPLVACMTRLATTTVSGAGAANGDKVVALLCFLPRSWTNELNRTNFVLLCEQFVQSGWRGEIAWTEAGGDVAPGRGTSLEHIIASGDTGLGAWKGCVVALER